MGEIPTTSKENPQKGNECKLKLMSTPKLLHSNTLTSVSYCGHISCVRLDLAWVSDECNLVLINKTGDKLHYLNYNNVKMYGAVHTVNCDDELLYMHFSKEYMDTITKLSNDMKTKVDIIVNKGSTLIPQCMYWSSSTEDLLIRMIHWK